MRHSSIDDVGFADAAAECGDAGFYLGQHSAGDRAVFDHGVDLAHGEVADAAFGVFDVSADAVRVGDDDDLVGLHRGGDCAGGGVGVDVQLAAGPVSRDRRDTRDRVGLHEQLQQPGVYAGHIA